MIKYFFCTLFFYCGCLHSQTLEEAIYTATETFNSNTSQSTYLQLEAQETIFRSQLKTESEQLAFVFLLCNKAYYSKNKTPNKAITTYEVAWNRFVKHKLSSLSNYDMIENCLKPLGNLYTKTGDYANAESTIKQYIHLAEQNNSKTHKTAGAINLSQLYFSIGNYNSALQIINSALKAKDLNPIQKRKLLNIKNESLIALGKTQKLALNNAKIIAPSFDAHTTNFLLELNNGNYKKALSHLNHIKSYNEKGRTLRDRAKLLFQEAQLYYLLEEPNKSITVLEDATKTLLPDFKGNELPKKEHLYAENTFIDIFDLLAELQPESDKKRDCYDLSFYVSDLLLAQVNSQKTKLLNLTNNRLRSEKCIEACFIAFNNTQNSQQIIDAFYYAEKHKAAVLKEMSLKKSLFQQFPKDSLLRHQNLLILKQERIISELTTQQLSVTQNASFTNSLYKELSVISIQLKQLEQKIDLAYPDTFNKSFTIETLQQKLTTDNATLIEYFYGKYAIYQFVISNEELSFYKIPLTEEHQNNINTFVRQFDNASIINNDISKFTENAFNTYKTLNLTSVSSHQNLVIIPDGLLNFIPFEALLIHKTVTTNYSKMPFVVTKHHIAYNASVQFYLKENEAVKSNSLLGVFPVFENSNQALTYSINEAEAINKKMNTTLLMQNKATKSNFIENASKFDILHLSTHATSGTYTKPARIEFYDSTMTLNELYSLNINNELVVLSACETGVGHLQKGEGALSIARGFQYAGAKRLLFSLWQINDLSTSQIMQSFYENYSDNSSGIIANQNSKISYLKNDAISNIKKSPYYWSAFVYYGDFSSAPQTNFSMRYIYILVIIAIIILFLIYKINSNAKVPES